tara:strand:- start:2204 stop:2320 length:117 start_codon:yes stop_codon:yes gene_type:complete
LPVEVEEALRTTPTEGEEEAVLEGIALQQDFQYQQELH